MQVIHVKILRRSMIGLIVIVLLAVAYNYLQTWRRRAAIIRPAMDVLSADMMRSADSIEYSTYDNGKVRFKIHAERLLETRGGKSLLQGVEASDRSTDGSGGNQIRSERAEYDADHKLVDFSGDVRLSIGSDVEIRTPSLHYDLNTNVGNTDDRIRFESKQAQGTARGIRYRQDRKTVELAGDLDFYIARPVTKPDGSVQTDRIHATSNRGYYSREERILRFQENARLSNETSALSGEDIVARFSEDQRHLVSLVCDGSVTYQANDSGEPLTLQGDRMDFGIVEDTGSLRDIDVLGHAGFSSKTAAAGQDLRGSTIHVEMDPVGGQLNRVQGQGGVEFQMNRDTEQTLATGERLDTAFLPGTSLLASIEVQGHAQMVMKHGSDAGRDDLSAQEIHMLFRKSQDRSALSELHADKEVQWKSSPPATAASSNAQTTRSLTAASLKMIYSKTGDYLDSGEAGGNVVLTGLPSEEAQRPEIRRLTAGTVQFHFFPVDNRLKDFDGNGSVEVFYQKPPDPETDSPAQEFHTSSEKMRAMFRETDGAMLAVSQWGNFRYQDGARLANAGRGDYDAEKDIMTMLESPRLSDPSGRTTGDTMEFDRKKSVLTVSGHVRSFLKSSDAVQATPFTSSAGSSSPAVVTAGQMQYWVNESRARYTGDVQLLSENGQLQASVLEIYNGGERVEAQGNIRHLIPQSNANGSTKPAGGRSPEAKGTRPDPRGSPILISCAQLQYLHGENIVYYRGSVRLRSNDTDMTCDSLDAVLDQEGRQVERAAAKGMVDIHQADRQVKSDTADYFLEPGKFVAAGNPAEIWSAGGKSAARRLTFFTADDRILLENR